MATDNKTITFKGNPIEVQGDSLSPGQHVPDFNLVGTDMSEVGINDFSGKVLVISSVPSLDTPVCSVQTKHFNQSLETLGSQVAVLTVSRDLPMAQKRWCGAEGVENVTCASDYKHRTFGKAFGVELPTLALLARAVVVVDTQGKIAHVEYVSEIAEEPDYDAAIAAVKELL
jgi:thiol peroxidase